MRWNSEDIKVLRLRFGWSHSDLARRLSCESNLILSWEHGENQPLDFHLRELDMIANHAEVNSLEVLRAPFAEARIDQNQLQQIDLRNIDN